MPKELHVLGSAVVIIAILLALASLSDAGTATNDAGPHDLQHRIASDATINQ
jgi:hypothetical protein